MRRLLRGGVRISVVGALLATWLVLSTLADLALDHAETIVADLDGGAVNP